MHDKHTALQQLLHKHCTPSSMGNLSHSALYLSLKTRDTRQSPFTPLRGTAAPRLSPWINQKSTIRLLLHRIKTIQPSCPLSVCTFTSGSPHSSSNLVTEAHSAD